MKKVLSVILAVSLVLSLGVSAFATETNKGNAFGKDGSLKGPGQNMSHYRYQKIIDTISDTDKKAEMQALLDDFTAKQSAADEAKQTLEESLKALTSETDFEEVEEENEDKVKKEKEEKVKEDKTEKTNNGNGSQKEKTNNKGGIKALFSKLFGNGK